MHEVSKKCRKLSYLHSTNFICFELPTFLRPSCMTALTIHFSKYIVAVVFACRFYMNPHLVPRVSNFFIHTLIIGYVAGVLLNLTCLHVAHSVRFSIHLLTCMLRELSQILTLLHITILQFPGVFVIF